MLSKGVSQTVQAFGIEYFSQAILCDILLYVYRVARGVSVSTTCLLSVFQTVKISPMSSSWKQLKANLPKHIGLSIFLSWSLNMLVNCIFPFYSISKYCNKNITKIKNFGYCSAVFQDKITEALYTAFILFPEVSCSGIMIWSSGSMIFILTNVSHKSSPESRATQSVLVLVCSFVCFYTLSSFFYACVMNFDIPHWWLMNTSALISTCFPAVSPFVLMSCNSTASRLLFKFSCLVRSSFCLASLLGFGEAKNLYVVNSPSPDKSISPKPDASVSLTDSGCHTRVDNIHLSPSVISMMDDQ
ncbi:PREDICTED: vomeronasal type-1 receptor 4-like [Chinchilla lanigera]|uniref:vomeronasal type-1 receptor 4-like n=1 Tax=Chinchilla lanigera TaxID=34839 RepID=UPI0006965711|nr:PREDICTED: vomeronasal type-1 receptor 4-like [Chinchilla lanigera]